MSMLIEKTQEEREQLRAICGKLGRDELLGQATEESCELGQACQKVRRARKGTTPVKLPEATGKLDEEAGDVLLLIDCLVESGVVNLDAAVESARRKIARWYGRAFGEGGGT